MIERDIVIKLSSESELMRSLVADALRKNNLECDEIKIDPYAQCPFVCAEASIDAGSGSFTIAFNRATVPLLPMGHDLPARKAFTAELLYRYVSSCVYKR